MNLTPTDPMKLAARKLKQAAQAAEIGEIRWALLQARAGVELIEQEFVSEVNMILMREKHEEEHG